MFSAPVTCSSTRPVAPPGTSLFFEAWTDETKASYLGYEQSADGGIHHRVIPFPYSMDSR
jgi:hypothetical protein